VSTSFMCYEYSQHSFLLPSGTEKWFSKFLTMPCTKFFVRRVYFAPHSANHSTNGIICMVLKKIVG
jgi:hypothetical protein